MDTKKISAVVVEDKEDLTKYYLISHSDIVAYLTANSSAVDLYRTKAKDLMHGPIESISPEAPIEKVVQIMFTMGFKRLIIGNDQKQPIGIITTKDILAWNNNFFRAGNPILLAVLDNDTGIVLTQKFFRKEFSQDLLELFGGSITAITAITNEVLQKSGGLRVIEKEYYVIMLESRDGMTGILVADYQTIDLSRKLQTFIKRFIDEYREDHKMWKNNMVLSISSKCAI